ncbi:MAG TPA: ATP-binding domain-containing protein [Burkholderiaceae bacterium]|nr:ATP-binding domain-containing protein [Burkholderiaceae bacterium]
MARILPDGWREYAESTGAARRHLDVLERLAAGLSDAYTVYHGVHWTNAERDYAIHGQIDLAIVNRAGALVVIEVVSGFLDETADGLVKRLPNRSRNVSVQLARTAAQLRAKLAARPGIEPVAIEHLLYCPDHRVANPSTAALGPERIVDAARRDQLAAAVRALLPEGAPERAAQQVHRFLRDVIELQPDVAALIGQVRDAVTRVAGGLAFWARQLEFEPFRLRVTGTAGSGKTQLALAEFDDAVARGKRALYVCYNRPLADHVARICARSGDDRGARVHTFHALCEARLRSAGQSTDFSRADAFDALVERAAKLPVGPEWRFDTVIVDEGQDFPEAWRDQVLALAEPHARVIWLEDPLQNLYAREPVALPGFVRLRARSNFRSPRAVISMLQPLLPPEVAIEARGPLNDGDVELITYRDPRGALDATKEAVTHCLAAGFRRADIAIISFRGRDASALLSAGRLGPHTLRAFTGRYDLLGQPLYSDGELLVESVYRFKGQAAPAVVLSEIDFDALDARAVRKLFVGATRAMMKLVLVASERAAALLERGLHRPDRVR